MAARWVGADGFRRGLREVGLVEGRDFVIEFALPQNAAQVPSAAAELVRSRVDILLASGCPPGTPQAKSRSCSWRPSIQWPQDSSQAWPGQAATSPV
jgi:hypothetical protein